ncbi:MAG: antibiotic biosynthesis monooxygenase [Sphingomonadales bacterium]
MPLISITRLRVRSWRFLPDFLLHSVRIMRQARSAPGNLGAETLRESGMTFWTKSAWRDEAALRAFLASAPHKTVTPHLQRWCSEASVLHWEQESPRLPFWEDAGRRMQRDGRLIEVKRPSDDHAAGRIPPMKQ